MADRKTQAMETARRGEPLTEKAAWPTASGTMACRLQSYDPTTKLLPSLSLKIA
jgi:hypothetical protein